MNNTNKKVVKKKIKTKQAASRSSEKESTRTDSGQLKHKEQQQQDEEFYHKKAYLFMKTLKRDYKRLALIYNSCIKAEQERERLNKDEIDHLKKKYNQMQVERADIKRKRWCRYCESEATYLSSMGTNFYCSQECEQKQNELVSAMNDIFKM